MANGLISTLLIFVFVTVVHGGQWCTDYSSDIFESPESFWCEHGCCGDRDDRHCCLSSEAGAIVGIVIGCLLFIGLVISAIVFCVCYRRRRRGQQGQVVTGQGAGTSVQMTTVQSPYMQQPYMQQQQQQPYMPQQGPYPTGAYPAMAYPPMQPGMQPGNPNPGFEPPKYSEAVNSQ